ncbi:MAG: T9SS type A sorting domain-containing protein [Bacteroidales bacterium]|nr:T9SS type A sorting domain-containing protein [Bacteroidales bacterium]
MRKLLFSLLTLIGFVSVMASNGYDVKLKQTSNSTKTLEFTVNDFDLKTVNYGGTEFTKILFDGKVLTKENGFAELPYVNANIQLNPVNNVSMEVNPLSFTDYQLDFPLVPSRGVIYRNQDPSLIPYEIAPESMVDAYYPESITQITDPFIIKDVRGATVYFYPFQYNAVSQTLRVFDQVEVVLTENNQTPVNPLLETSGKYFPEMEAIYSSVFINYESSKDDLTVAEAGDILVITTARDEAAIQPYIDWKMEKGYDVFKEVVATGTNVKSLIQTKYNENSDILYVQLVGDWADIKSDLGGGANAPMDPMLGCVVGTDYFPEIGIGRFSAGSSAQVTTQVNKTITYEKNPTGDWYNNAIGVASNQGPGDDNELDYQQIDVIFDNKLDPFTYDQMSTAYDPSGTSTMVKNYIEQGASIINYCGHGSQNSWGSTGFSSTNVNQLTNGDMLPFIFSVACVNGAFHSGDCFAEAWLRKENGGAIMTLMATINQPWDPPMRGQDYFNDVLTGGYDYTSNPGNGISTDEGRTIIGSIVANGLVLMYTEASQGEDLETVQTWTTFGDVALQIRTDEPATVTLSNNVMLVGADFETTVNVNGAPFEGAMVALSQDGVYASAYSDASGLVSIPNNFLPGDVRIVVTGLNTQTIYETIQCIPPTGPYVIFNEVEVNTESGMLVYGEASTLNLAMKNVGVSNATNVEVSIATDDEYVTISDATENFGTIAPDQVVMMQNAFEVEVANDIPDGHGVLFTVTAVGGETWESSFSLVAVAGVLEYADYYIVDLEGNNNGKLDPGETAELMVSIANTGGAEAMSIMAELLTNDMYVTVNTGEVDYGDIAAGESAAMSFSVSADESTPAGHIASFDFNFTADKDLAGAGSFITVVGQIPVLIIDMDENSSSAPEIAAALDQIGLSYEESSALPADLNLYSSIFVCLGIYSSNTQLSSADGQALADYLNAGGNLYMEGGDTWYYDDQTAVHGMFGLSGSSDGSGDLGTILGEAGTFTEGMTFNYTGENNWIDHLDAAGGVVILTNQSPAYGTAVAYDAGIYNTIGASHEFGGLDATSRTALMEGYLDFFGMMPSSLVAGFNANETEGCVGMEVEFTDASFGATSWNWFFPGGYPESSTEQNPTVSYSTEGSFDVTLEISDGNSTTSMTKSNYISVMDVPEQAGPIDGETEVAMGETEEYHVDAMDDCTLYNWVITPEGAGTMEIEMNSVTVTWSATWMGTAMLKVCGGNDCGMGEFSEDFEIAVMDPTGIYDFGGNTVGIYPNPNNGQFSIELNSTEATSYQVKLVNSLGVEIISKTINVSGKYNENVDVSAMAEGIYYLYLQNEKNTIVEKIVIQK